MITLDKTKKDIEYRVVRVGECGMLKYRLYDLGIFEGSKIKRLKSSPLGDPVSYFVKGTTIAIRNRDAEKIEVEEL